MIIKSVCLKLSQTNQVELSRKNSLKNIWSKL